MDMAQYLQAIAKLKTMPPDYDSLSIVWWKHQYDGLFIQITNLYNSVGLNENQIVKMVELNVNKYKASLTEEEYKIQLNQIHQLIIDNGIKEMEKKIKEIPVGTHWSGDKPGTIAK